MHKKIKVQLLVNEVAGNGNAIKADKELQDILKEMNIPFKRQKSYYPGELVVLAQNYANLHLSSEHVLIVVGGDGSFNEVLNGIKTSNYPETAITYLPARNRQRFCPWCWINRRSQAINQQFAPRSWTGTS